MTEIKAERMRSKNTDFELHFQSQSGHEAGSSSSSQCDAGLSHAFVCVGGFGAGLGSTFECTGGSKVVSSSTFEGHCDSVASPSATLEHTGGFEGARAAPFERSGVILGSLVASRWPERLQGPFCATIRFFSGVKRAWPPKPRKTRT